MIQAAAKTRLGHSLRISAGAVRDALDPMRDVANRNGIGGPAPTSVTAMLHTAQQQLGAERERLAEREARLAIASIELDKSAAGVLNGTSTK